jgi:hypothetical protein
LVHRSAQTRGGALLTTVLNCRDCILELGEYLDGALAADARAAFDAHLRRCGKCRIVCQTTRTTVELYRKMPLPAIPPELRARLMTAIETRSIGDRR